MTVPNKTPERATRKTVITGESAPELTTNFRPIPLGIDRQGDPSGQIRAFAVAIRNRSDGTVWVKESDESDPVPIERFESYNIWETNGISEVYLKGDSGAETVELRLLVAHNNFDVTDKIDAFVRAINHFLTQNKQETVITDSETTFNVDGNVTIDDIVTGTVDIANVNDSVDIASGVVSIDQINDGIDIDSGTVTIGDITGQTTSLTVDGSVTVDDIVSGTVDIGGGNVVVDDITTTSTTFDGDITGQDAFDLSMASRQGQSDSVSFDINGASVGYYNQNLSQQVAEFWNAIVRDNATYDGFITRVELRVFDTSSPDSIGFETKVDYGSNGSWRTVSPRATMRGNYARRFNGNTVFTPRFYPNGEVVIVWEPSEPVAFEAGDTVGVEVGPQGTTAGTGTADYELEVQVTDIVTK